MFSTVVERLQNSSYVGTPGRVKVWCGVCVTYSNKRFGSKKQNSWDIRLPFEHADQILPFAAMISNDIPLFTRNNGVTHCYIYNTESSTRREMTRVFLRGFLVAFVAFTFTSTTTMTTCDAFVHHLRPSPRVTLGTELDSSRVPFFCSLHVNFPDDSGTFVCGCALISPTVGTTAAHCVVKDAMRFTDARVRLYGSMFSSDALRLAPGAVAVHPEYGVGDPLANDVAVFRLAEPLAVDLLPTINRERSAWDALTSWDRLTVVGVGKTSNADTGALSLGTPLYAHLSRRDCEHPENLFGEALLGWGTRAHLGDVCAGPYAPCRPDGTCADSCRGDSGGPLFAETGDGNVTLYGLVSRGNPECGLTGERGGRPGIYAPTDEHWMFMTTVGETLDPRPPYLESSRRRDDRSSGRATTMGRTIATSRALFVSVLALSFLS